VERDALRRFAETLLPCGRRDADLPPALAVVEVPGVLAIARAPPEATRRGETPREPLEAAERAADKPFNAAVAGLRAAVEREEVDAPVRGRWAEALAVDPRLLEALLMAEAPFWATRPEI